ncbi:MAG: hypothetical protein ACI841_003888 [Planctomycetota bacterium]|jgi:hypothetical protein
MHRQLSPNLAARHDRAHRQRQLLDSLRCGLATTFLTVILSGTVGANVRLQSAGPALDTPQMGPQTPPLTVGSHADGPPKSADERQQWLYEAPPGVAPDQYPVELHDSIPLPTPARVKAGAKRDTVIEPASGDPYFLGFAAGPYDPDPSELLDPQLIGAMDEYQGVSWSCGNRCL